MEGTEMKAGWNVHNNKWYYINEQGVKVVGWIDLNGKRYWADEKGEVVLNDWRKIDNCRYYFNSSGEAVSGWNWIDEGYYFFYPNETSENPRFSMAHDTCIDGHYVDLNGRRR